MIITSYIESFKDYVFKNKNRRFNESKDDNLNSFNVSFGLKTPSSKLHKNKENKSVKKQVKFKSNEAIYENIREDDLSNSCFSRSTLSFKSDSSSKACNKSLSTNQSSLLNEIQSPINHQCIESKVIKTRLNQSQQSNNSFSEQKCIHQSHPECLNLSNANEGCLVCNALTVGRKYEMSSSFKSTALAANNQKKPIQNNLLNELNKLIKIGWYWGKLSRFEAENKLIHTSPGTFLIRDSFDNNYILSLSFRINEGVFHTRIEYKAGHFQFYLHPNKKYKTVSDLVDDLILCSQTGIHYYVKSRKTGKEILFKIKIDKPLSRFNQIKSLKYLCRFTIKQNIRYDLIQKLPIPDAIKNYLEENHF